MKIGMGKTLLGLLLHIKMGLSLKYETSLYQNEGPKMICSIIFMQSLYAKVCTHSSFKTREVKFKI